MAAGVAKPIAHGHATIKMAAAMMKPAAAPTGGCACQRNRRQRVVNFARRFRRESPPKPGGDGDGDDDGHEHTAHAVAKALDVGAAGLGALHGGDDVGQRGGFAGGGHAHDEPAVQIHRAGEKLAAGFFVRGHGLAGEHRLVHGGIAFDHDAVHRHAVAGFERHEVADFQFGNGNFDFGVRSSEFGVGNPPRGLRGEVQQRFQARRTRLSLTRASSQ